VAGIAREGAEQGLVALVLEAHAAAGAVHDRHDAVDVLKVAEPGGLHRRLGDEAGDRARAVHRGEHADIVAGAEAAVVAAVAHEAARRLDRGERGCVDADGVIAAVLAHAEVLGVDMGAGRDVGGGAADDLAVADHRLARGDGAERDLVAALDRLGERDALGQDGAGGEVLERDGDGVVGMQDNAVGSFGLLDRGHGQPRLRERDLRTAARLAPSVLPPSLRMDVFGRCRRLNGRACSAATRTAPGRT
jgi:hypothetical protein